MFLIRAFLVALNEPWHGLAELELVARPGWRAWPPRLSHQPIFYPMLSLEYARKYPHSLHRGMVLEIAEGSRVVGYAEVLEVYNELLRDDAQLES